MDLTESVITFRQNGRYFSDAGPRQAIAYCTEGYRFAFEADGNGDAVTLVCSTTFAGITLAW